MWKTGDKAIYIGLRDLVGGVCFVCVTTLYHMVVYLDIAAVKRYYTLAVMQVLTQPKKSRYWRSSTIESMATLSRRWMLWTMESQPLMELQGGCVRECVRVCSVHVHVHVFED